MDTQKIVNQLQEFRTKLDQYWSIFEYVPSFGNAALSRKPWDCWFALEDLYRSFLDIFKIRPNVEHLPYEHKQNNNVADLKERSEELTKTLNEITTFLKTLSDDEISECYLDLLNTFQFLESYIIGVLSFQDPGFLSKHKWEDRMVISFPKCGRTWFQFTFGRYMLNLRYADKTVPLTKMTSTHGGALELKWNSPSLYWFPIIRKLVHLNRKNVFIVRDPRDVLVSWYFHTTRREHVVDDKTLISDFIRGEHTGIPRVVQFYNVWQYVISHQVCSVVILRYENMSKNLYAEMSKALSHWDLPIHSEILQKSLDESTFQKMREFETRIGKNWKHGDGYFELKPGNLNDPDSYKVRRGVVGGYVDYLSKDDIQYVNKYLKENLTNTLPEFQYV
jgi:hypothetical protein